MKAPIPPGEIPLHMRLTYQMLLCAYPDGIPQTDYHPLLYVLQDSGMSYRSVAHAISLVMGGTIGEHSYQVGNVVSNITLREDDIGRILHKLRQCGYDEWIKEE